MEKNIDFLFRIALGLAVSICGGSIYILINH